MRIYTSTFGYTADGQRVTRYTMTNSRGIKVSVIDYGCTITELWVPDRSGTPTDIVLGYDTVADYEAGDAYFGAFVGRVANRIKDSRFTLHGKEYRLTPNDGLNHLHGVMCRRVFHGEVAADALRLRYVSPDGEEGLPGEVAVCVTYALDDNNVLTMKYEAVSTKDTVLNLTNHSYFNLAGHGSGAVDDQLLQMAADAFCETADDCCPTGTLLPVEGTPMDFRTLRHIGQGFPLHYEQMELVGGYDHNFCLRPDSAPAALAYAPATGIALSIVTTQPGIQFYSGNGLSRDHIGKGGVRYCARGGFCLETQHYPCAPNYENFPSVELKAGEKYEETTLLQLQILETL